MEPNNTHNESLNLPLPSVEGGIVAPQLHEKLSTDTRAESGAEESSSRQQVAAAFQKAPAPVLPAVSTGPQSGVGAPAQSSNPLAADDQDMIEKVWVDRIKEILRDTKDNPHAREEQISALQRDYIQKRYGIVVGKVDD